MNLWKVAVHTGDNDNGVILYNEETKEVEVRIPNQELAKLAHEYLTTEKKLHHYTGLQTYEEIQAVPADSLKTLKLALGYMWKETGVHVDWSRPAELYTE